MYKETRGTEERVESGYLGEMVKIIRAFPLRLISEVRPSRIQS